jgi:hypothetical protein
MEDARSEYSAHSSIPSTSTAMMSSAAFGGEGGSWGGAGLGVHFPGGNEVRVCGCKVGAGE